MTSLPSAKRTYPKLQYEHPTRALVSGSGKGNYRRAIKAREEWLIHNGWSSVTTGASATKLPDNIKYMVVDVETHNWKEGTNVPDGRIVEIAWKLVSDEGNCLESKQYLLKPHGYNEIAQKATEVHGITTEYAKRHGSDANSVFDEFTTILKAIPQHGFVIAYDMFHEDSIFMHNLTQEQRNVWDNAPKCDTYSMNLWKHLPQKAKKGIIWRTLGLKLTDLHKIVSTTGTKSCDAAHIAIADVEMTWNIFKYYSKPDRASRAELEWTRKRKHHGTNTIGGLRTRHKSKV